MGLKNWFRPLWARSTSPLHLRPRRARPVSRRSLQLQLEELEARLVPVTLLSLASFSGGPQPQSGLIQDSSGNLIGTTSTGGPSGDGTVFEVASGSEIITTLATFTGDNGSGPNGDLIEDSNGNLFGTTSAGGPSGDGTVFEVAQGSGTITTLASFNSNNGYNPQGGLVQDSHGNLFGTTSWGGPSDDGTVFEVASRQRNRHHPGLLQWQPTAPTPLRA